MPLHIALEDGGFHAKGAYLALEHGLCGRESEQQFPRQPRRAACPTIQGAVRPVRDARDGQLLAIMDSIEITSKAHRRRERGGGEEHSARAPAHSTIRHLAAAASRAVRSLAAIRARDAR
jgi:hypothetical protein